MSFENIRTKKLLWAYYVLYESVFSYPLELYAPSPLLQGCIMLFSVAVIVLLIMNKHTLTAGHCCFSRT